jgi:AraC family transcriptional activator of pobA
MRKKGTSIPVNIMANEFGTGIAVERFIIDDSNDPGGLPTTDYAEAYQSHRHDGHSFFLLEKGMVRIDIDFERFDIIAPSVIYIHPDQVHQTILSEHLVVKSLAINDEHINPEYLKLLQMITPAKPVTLPADTFAIINEAIGLCILLSEQQHHKLHPLVLKDSCNTFVGLVISQYLALAQSTNRLSRFDIITKNFRALLDLHFTKDKRPAYYADRLNISTAYLNESVKNATGYPVSHHIQHRVVLEAKRMLYHSNASVKEIAVTLGYDDYAYFSRIFTKITGITALAFRKGNRG